MSTGKYAMERKREMRPILAAVGAALAFAILMVLFGDLVPGEEMEQLLWQFILFSIGWCLLPPLAFGWAARNTNIWPLNIVVGVMVGFQVVLPMLFIFVLNMVAASSAGAVVLVILIAAVQTISALLALAVTGNLRRVIGSSR